MATDRLPTRQRLPNRRASETLDFTHGLHRFTLALSRFDNGQLAEIFISANKPGSEIEAIARDSAITASLAFQFGCPIETLRAALTKDHDGSPATVLGSALDAIGNL
jgi:hypothetical protein